MASNSVPAEFQDLFDKIKKEQFPYSQIVPQKELIGGKSGACVLLIDINPKKHLPKGNSVPQLSGQFILKMSNIVKWQNQEESEPDRHQTAISLNPDFSKDHIPNLLYFYIDENRMAQFYEIAGRSLVNLTTCETVDADTLYQYCGQVSRAILYQFNKDYSIKQSISSGELMQSWLGYRLNRDQASGLHEFINEETGGKPLFFVRGQILVNPLWFCQTEAICDDTTQARMMGFIHGDLHPGNLLIQKGSQTLDKYWFIDFALSRKAPIGYDHSYLELALLISYLQGLDPERLIRILDILNAPGQSDNPSVTLPLPIKDVGLVSGLLALRKGMKDWQEEKEKFRVDAFAAQILLSRVAVGINWANKPIDVNSREQALIYSAWAARMYLEIYHDRLWGELLMAFNSKEPEVRRGKPNTQEWEQLWKDAGGFDEETGKYILITNSLKGIPNLASLGFLPWSAIIDLDSTSDIDGLFKFAAPILEKSRSIKQFGKDSLPVDFSRGTAWLMVNGWESRNERVPISFREWRVVYSKCVRTLAEEMKKAISPQSIRIVVLLSDDKYVEHLERILEALDESIGALTTIDLVCEKKIDSPLVNQTIQQFPADFIAAIRETYGNQEDIRDPEIPGADGPVKLPIDRLRNLEEDLDILHSRILTPSFLKAHVVKDEFWRGTPPSWMDLHFGLDIQRDIHPRLLQRLTELLEKSQNLTVELHHAPGAGGTTTALRAGWSLRNQHPVVILRRYSKLTLDRIDQVFQIAQRPILLIADISILPIAAREELYRGFAIRNSRVVILHVIRMFQPVADLRLSGTMESKEAEKFNKLYSEKTNSTRKLKMLAQITSSPDDRWSRYRSPFFYGLTTYGSDFSSIGHYVQVHLEEIKHKAREIMLYLALVTRYTQTGIDESVIRGILKLRPLTALNLKEVLGAPASNLVLRHDHQLKLLHPLIAEEVLRQLLGGEDKWTESLADVSLDFIHDLVDIAGNESTETLRLLSQLFIRREYWATEDAAKVGPGKTFSELIQHIPSPAGQHQVFQELTQKCPSEAHFWNHLGRHNIYIMQQSYEIAEGYLKKAIELDGTERIHWHSLGMVYRFWIKDLLEDIRVQYSKQEYAYDTGEERGQQAERILNEVRYLAVKAYEAFGMSRELAPDDQHGYITAIQLTLEIAETLLRVSNVADFSTLRNQRSSVGDWLRHHFTEAEELLSIVQKLRAESKPSRYELKLLNKLSDIYGDFDDMIDSMETMLVNDNDDLEQVDLRRALATAYYARGKRKWVTLKDDELRRITELMERNLTKDPSNDYDIRTWFQAYRRLPEFSYLQALERLEGWSRRSNAAEAYYYLYILHYLLWRNRIERDETLILDNLRMLKHLDVGRGSHHSYEWLAKGPEWCPLVHYSDLGNFDQKLKFYTNTISLAPVTGTIKVITGPQAGQIRIGETLHAFFVPGTNFWESQDLNKIVHFYLGFSYDGFRAWTIPQNKLTGTSDADTLQQVRQLVFSTLDLAEKEGSSLKISFIKTKLLTIFSGEPAHKRLGFGSLEELLRTFPDIEVDPATHTIKKLGTIKSEIASKKEFAVQDGISQEFVDEVRVFILNNVQAYQKQSGEMPMTHLGMLLKEKYPGESIYRRLGYPSLKAMIKADKNIEIIQKSSTEAFVRIAQINGPK